MGGGEGAKERRRLKRLTGPSMNSKRPVTTTKVLPVVPSISAPLVTTNSFKVKKAHIQSKTGISGNDEQPPVRKEKNVKKPKHLKRKLEQLSQDDDQTREIIKKEMAQFEEIKSKLAQKSNKKRPKREEKEHDQYASKNSVGKDSDAPPEMCIDHDALNKTQGTNNSHMDVPLIDKESRMANDETEKGNNDDDSDVGENSKTGKADAPTRERGRRRRGRKDTAKQILETQVDGDSENKELLCVTNKSQVTRIHELQEMKGTDQKRYCIGRKPVTDFVLGQKYVGKVVYVKDFGVFFDIGCHSDAFCHVSRLHDDFLKDPYEMYKAGDEVEVRIVEIDRKLKRITVSLQSDERIVDERASLEARAQRKKNRNESRRKVSSSVSKQEASRNSTSKVDGKDSSDQVSAKSTIGVGGNGSKAVKSKDPMSRLPGKPVSSPAKAAAEEKRLRKLARRAARREQGA